MTHMVKKIILDNWTQTLSVYPTCVKRATCKASVWKCLSPGRPWCSDAVLLTILPPCTCPHNYNSKHLKHNIGFCVGLYLPFPPLFFTCSAFFYLVFSIIIITVLFLTSSQWQCRSLVFWKISESLSVKNVLHALLGFVLVQPKKFF